MLTRQSSGLFPPLKQRKKPLISVYAINRIEKYVLKWYNSDMGKYKFT